MAIWCLSCSDRYTGRPAQVGGEHGHRDDAHHAARLHADDHEAEIRRFVTAARHAEIREMSGWTTAVHHLVAAATRKDPDGGVWRDGTGYRLIPAGARYGAKGRRVRRHIVELVIAAGFLYQDEHGDVTATADGRAMLTAWRHHRADLAAPGPPTCPFGRGVWQRWPVRVVFERGAERLGLHQVHGAVRRRDSTHRLCLALAERQFQPLDGQRPVQPSLAAANHHLRGRRQSQLQLPRQVVGPEREPCQ
ncbi:hypothetical protein [Kitasatospora griseola]|uniref:hypothetical protein n=1 Tax=Kitasatospora griseola TaxID=2064 RepID=UPI0034199F17